jgi:hypothetical protein
VLSIDPLDVENQYLVTFEVTNNLIFGGTIHDGTAIASACGGAEVARARLLDTPFDVAARSTVILTAQLSLVMSREEIAVLDCPIVIMTTVEFSSGLISHMTYTYRYDTSSAELREVLLQ